MTAAGMAALREPEPDPGPAATDAPAASPLRATAGAGIA